MEENQGITMMIITARSCLWMIMMVKMMVKDGQVMVQMMVNDGKLMVNNGKNDGK